MTRIVLDPEELASTSTELRGAAGEYQAIGSRVASCNCGCMPADVAAVVDAAAAAIRARLNSVSSWLVADSSDLAQRAGIPQSGAAAMSAAAGGSYVGAADGQHGASVLGGGGYNLVVGGGDFDTSVFGGGGGYNLVVGGGFDTSVFGGGGGDGYDLVIGSDFDTSVFDPGPELGSNFNLTDWGLGGTGYGNRTLGSFTPTTYRESMAVLTGMALRNNDWFSLNTVQNIQASNERAILTTVLPDGWRLVNGYGW
jgi:hypothetical protein